MPTGSSNNSSNIVTLYVIEPSFLVTKTSNKSNIKVGDSFFYTIDIINNGDYPASSVVITDTLPTQFNVTDITVDGVSVTGDLSIGIDIGPLPAGDSFSIIVYITVTGDIYNSNGFTNNVNTVFSVVIDPLQPPTTVTINTTSSSNVKIFNPELQLLKSANILNSAIGDTVTFTILVENTGNVILSNIIVRDLLSPTLVFINNSLKIDGKAVLSNSITSGVRIKTLNPEESATITFDVLIVGDSSTVSTNKATSQFNYQIDCNSFMQTGFASSNELDINILYHNVTLTKKADVCSAKFTGIIDYIITVTNNGDIDILDFILKDKIPANVIMIDNSIFLNDINFIASKVDLLKGISIGSLEIGQTSIIKFSVRIRINSCCNSCYFENMASGSYYFSVPDGSNRIRYASPVSNVINICE